MDRRFVTAGKLGGDHCRAAPVAAEHRRAAGFDPAGDQFPQLIRVYPSVTAGQVTADVDMPGIAARSTRPDAGAISVPCPATAPTVDCCARAARTCACAALAAACACSRRAFE